jgi:hypothetical protein
MNQQTYAILLQMLFTISDYKNSKINLEQLANTLQGSLDAVDENFPEEFYKKWYEHWITIDTGIALSYNARIQQRQIFFEEVAELEKIIKGYLSIDTYKNDE